MQSDNNNIKDSQSKYWIFVYNNPDDQFNAMDLYSSLKCTYLVCQKEVGDKGTPHIQGYMEFSSARRFSTLKKKCPPFHLEPRAKFATASSNRHYCMKPHENCNCEHCSSSKDKRLDGPWEYGEISLSEQGKRNDLLAIKRKFDEGSTQRQVAQEDEHFPVWVKHYKAFILYQSLIDDGVRPVPKVVVIYGLPGVGKTHYINEHFQGSSYIKPTDNDWFDGYDNHKVVLFDEYEGWISWNLFLRVLDKYPCRVPIKGGFVWFRPETILITCNKHPSKWYDFKDRPLDALTRRITEWTFIYEKFKEPYCFSDYYEFNEHTQYTLLNC